MVMRHVKCQVGRRISFLIADSSYKRRFVGFFAKCCLSIPVARAQDNTKSASGKIYLKDPINNPLVITGEGTKFTTECEVKGLIALPKSCGLVNISEIRSDTELVIRKEVKNSAALHYLSLGCVYKVAGKIDHTQVYREVFDHLHQDGCIGIFPEGGSHDRTELLPLKAGVVIMALGAMVDNPLCDVKIVPCGLNYFHRNRFRSRAMVEFGHPISISPQMVEIYKNDPRKAVTEMLGIIQDALKSVTTQCPDYETLITIQAVRRLYASQYGKKLSLAGTLELNRRMITGYTHFKDNPDIQRLVKDVADFDKRLRYLHIRDHQLANAKFGKPQIIYNLITRSIKLIVLSILSIPGTILFSPIFLLCHFISKKKQAEALKKSSVKIAAKDVIATWKILVAMGATPLLYTFYSFIGTFLLIRYDYLNSLSDKLIGFIFSYSLLAITSLSALIIGEQGVDILKSLKPMWYCLKPKGYEELSQLKARRQQLAYHITEIVNSLGPELYDDFDIQYEKLAGKKLVKTAGENEIEDKEVENNLFIKRRPRSDTTASDISTESNAISRVNSTHNLSEIPIFSNNNLYRTVSNGSGITTDSISEPISNDGDDNNQVYTTQAQFDAELSAKIRLAMTKREKAKFVPYED